MVHPLRSWINRMCRNLVARSASKGRRRRHHYSPWVECLEYRVTLSATPTGGQFLVNETLGPSDPAPAVAILDAAPSANAGDFIAVWQDYGRDGSGFGIFAQVFDKNGNAIAGLPSFQVNQPLSGAPGSPAIGNQTNASVASDGNGHFVISWQSEDQTGKSYDIYERQGSFNGSAVTLDNQVQANTLFVAGNQIAPTVAMDAAGDFVIAWQSQDLALPALGYDIYAKQGTLNGGLTTGSEFLVNTAYTSGNQSAPAASINSANGDFVITWIGPDPATAEASSGVFFNVFTPSLAQSGEVRANSAIYNDLSAPDVAMNDAGTIVVAWQVEGQSSSGSDIYGRRFSFNSSTNQVQALSTSTFGTEDFLLNTTIERPQRAPAVGIDHQGDFFAAWQTQNQDGYSWAIFGRRYDASSNTFGSEQLVNIGVQMGPQINPEIDMTGDGRTVVIWTGPDVPVGAVEGEGGHKPAIHAHIYDNAGAVSIGVGEIVLTTYSGLEDSPAATASDAAGNFVVVWQSWEDTGDGSDFGIYAKLFQANGKPIDLNGNGLPDDKLLVNTTTAGRQSNPSVAMDSAGDFVIVWQSALQDGSGTGIFARRYSASSQGWVGGEFQVNTTTLGDQSNPEVAMDAAGNFVIVWQSGDAIVGRRYAASGAPLSDEFQINVVSGYSPNSPVIAMNAAGQFVVGWVSNANFANDPADTEKSIFARWFQASGVPIGSKEFLVNVYTKDAQEHPEVGIDTSGNFVFTWQSINQSMNQEGVGSSWDVYARQFAVNSAAGTITSPTPEFRVNQTADGPQRFPGIAVDAAGNFTISWQSIRQDGSSWAILARQYNANGTAAGPETLVNTYTNGPQILPVIAQRPTGDFTIIWEGQANGHIEGISGQQFQYIRDNFDRGNFPSLGPDWTARIGNYDIHDNVAAVQTTLGLATLNKVSLANVAVEGYVTLGGGLEQSQGLVARYSGPGDSNMYLGELVGKEGDFTAEIWRNTGGTWTLLTSQSVAVGTGLLRFELVGPSLKLFLNDNLVAYTFDSTITTAGLIGMRGNFDSVTDNFTYAALTQVNATLPFNDSFNLSSGSQLSRFWTEREGNFTIQNLGAVGSPDTSLATVNGISIANVFVSADVNVANGGSAGLVTRYSQGPLGASMYQGDLVNENGVFYAEIWRDLNGTWTLLSQQQVASSSGSLRFEVIGNAQKLFLDGQLVVSTSDSLIGTAGQLGMRSLGSATYQDFSAGTLVATVSVTVSGNDLTLTSMDGGDHIVTVYQHGSSVVVSAVVGVTQIAYGNFVGTMAFVPISTVDNLTINLGTGSDSYVVYGLDVAGDIVINGQPTGIAKVAIYAGPPNVTIGGSILANFGGEKTTFGLFGSFNGGGNLTVNGSVNITEGGPATKQIDIYGPPYNNATGGKLFINGGLNVLDTGTGLSVLRVNDGVTIGGDLSYDNAANTVTNDDVRIYSNSYSNAATSIGGALSLALADNPLRGNNVEIHGFGPQLSVGGPATITSGSGADMIRLLDTWFKSVAVVNSGNSPTTSFDQAHIEGDRFDAAATVTMSGARPQLYIGTESAYDPTVFNSTFAALMTGPSALAYLSNPTSTVDQVVFNSTASFTGGIPFGTLFVRGLYYILPGDLIRVNFNIV